MTFSGRLCGVWPWDKLKITLARKSAGVGEGLLGNVFPLLLQSSMGSSVRASLAASKGAASGLAWAEVGLPSAGQAVLRTAKAAVCVSRVIKGVAPVAANAG